jgi:RNA polymerase sigma-70 factor (ECF subfamily)
MATMTKSGPQASPPPRESAGEAPFLDALYRRYAGWLARAMSMRLRSSPIEVDDIVQETYVRVARYGAADAARHPKALLLRIAVNLARDQMRRNVVRGGLAPPEDVERIGIAPDQHETAQLKLAILALPPIYRDVFVLSRFTGLTYEEIASHVGISVKTVEWRMSRALQLCTARLRD